MFKKGEYMHDKVNPTSIKNMSLAAKPLRKTQVEVKARKLVTYLS